MAKDPTHEEKKAANFARNFGGKKYAKGGLIDKIKKRFAYGGEVPPDNYAYDPNAKESHFKYEMDPKKLRKLALMGYKRDGTQNNLGKILGYSETFDTINHFRKKNYIKNSDTDTAKIIDKSSNATDKQWATGLVGSSSILANYYLPGSGAAVSGVGKSALNKIGGPMDKTDPSLVAAQARLESTAGYQPKDSVAQRSDKFIDTSSLISVSGASSLLKKKKKRNSYDPATPDPVIDNSDNLSGNNTFSGSMAKGGQIKGSGTAKSDSIPAKLPAKSFVVPAENAEEAKELRKKYLDGNKLAQVKGKSGVPVKVSNGEHLFTPREVAVLKSKGVDLNKLAPEAKEEDKLYAGGQVKSGGDDDLKKLQERAAQRRKQLEEQEKKRQAAEDVAAKNKAVQDEISKHNQHIGVTSGNIDNAKNALKRVLSNPNSSQEDIAAAQKKLGLWINRYNETKTELDYKKNPDNYVKTKAGYALKPLPSTPPSGAIQKAVSNVNANAKTTPVAKTAVPPVTKQGTTKAINKVTGLTPASLNGSASRDPGKVDNMMNDSEEVDPFEYPDNGRAEITKSNPDDGGLTEAEAAAQGANNNTPVGDQGDGSTADDKGGNKFGKLKGDYNAGDVLSLAQAGAGIVGLIKQGKRPVYGIGNDVIDDVEQAKRDAQYGLSPAEKALAERTINQQQVNAIANINNLSNGNAAVALNNSRAATVDTTNAKLGLLAKDALIKLEKRRYKSGLVNQLENRRRQQFEDKMQGFQQNQAALADLTGAGLSNFFQNQQFKESVKEQDKRNKLLGID